jgi:hypothetical protein
MVSSRVLAASTRVLAESGPSRLRPQQLLVVVRVCTDSKISRSTEGELELRVAEATPLNRLQSSEW